MADKKISALPASTTPLTGTEVLPIVQSSATKKVSVDDLTAGKTVKTGNVLVGATASALQGGGTGITIYHATSPEIKFINNATGTAITDGTAFGMSGNTFLLNNREVASVQIYTSNTRRFEISSLGDVELVSGNLSFTTAGKGIDFSATAGTGTSELFDDYEEGTWTPEFADAASGGNVSPSQGALVGTYTKVGNLVVCRFRVLNINTTGMTAGNDFFIRGFPFLSEGTTYNDNTGVVAIERITFTGAVALELPRNEVYARLVEYASNADDDYIMVSEVASNLGDIAATISYTTA